MKIRDWGVKDDAEDMDWPVWAGIVPLEVVAGAPETDPDSVVREIPGTLA